MIRLSLRLAFLIILLAGCATTSNIKQENRVTILLKDGTKIDGQVTDISSSTIAFEAIDRKKAYDYGEVIQLDLIRGIRMPNGAILSVKEYNAIQAPVGAMLVSHSRILCRAKWVRAILAQTAAPFQG